MKKLMLLLCIVFLSFSFIVPSFAAGGSMCSVEYNNASGFVFNPEGGDLFQNFKNMMPGDKKTQEVVFINTCTDRYVTFYFRIEPNKNYEKFLQYITIRTYQVKNDNKILLSEGNAADYDKFFIDYELGKYKPKEQGKLIAEVEVDKRMGNDMADTKGIIKWIFICEEDEAVSIIPPERETSTTKPNKKPDEKTTGNREIEDITTTREKEKEDETTTVLDETQTTKKSDNPSNEPTPFTGSGKAMPALITLVGATAVLLVFSKKKK